MKMKQLIRLLGSITIILFTVTCKDYLFDNPGDTNIKLTTPTNLTVSFSADTMATLSWQYSNADKYSFTVEMSSDGTNWQKLGDVNKATSLTAKRNFLVGENYSFRVHAHSDLNRSEYLTTQAAMAILAAPTELSVSFATDRKAVLIWKDNSSIETGFLIELCTDGINYRVIKIVNADVTTQDLDYDYEFGISYSFRVRAKTENNYSSYSNIFNTGLKPHSPILALPSNEAINQSTSIILSWNASVGSTSYIVQLSDSNTFTNLIIDENVGNVMTKLISGLSNSTIYYWRVKSINNFGMSPYSDTRIFITMQLPFTCGNSIQYSGQLYSTVQIGTQCWMKQSLNIGTRIQGSLTQSNNGEIEKYCYNDDVNNCAIYGGLYQWAEAVQYKNGATNSTSPSPAFDGNVQGICPSGWHIPTFADFMTLGTSVSNNGNALKAVGQGTGDGAGTNVSGFSVLLSGYRTYYRSFDGLGDYTSFWSAHVYLSTTYTYHLRLNRDRNGIIMASDQKDNGLSVRCIKD